MARIGRWMICGLVVLFCKQGQPLSSQPCPPDIDSLVSSLVNYREFLRTRPEYRENFAILLKNAHRLTGIDVADDSVIRDLICTVAGIPEDELSIERLSEESGYDAVSLAHGVLWLQWHAGEMQWSLIDSVETAQIYTEVYSGTNFPDFPVHQDFYTWDELPDSYLVKVFFPLVKKNPTTGEKFVPIRKLNRLLKECESLEEFVRKGFKHEPTAEEVMQTMNQYKQTRYEIFRTWDEDQKNGRFPHAVLRTFSRLNLEDVKRGGWCPDRCGVLVDLAMDWYHAASRWDPSIEQRITESGMLKNVTELTTDNLQPHLCSFFEGIHTLVDFNDWFERRWQMDNEFLPTYRQFSLDSMLTLMDTSDTMNELRETRRFIRLLDQTNFPSFPLRLTGKQHIELAESIQAVQPSVLQLGPDEEEDFTQRLAEALKDSKKAVRKVLGGQKALQYYVDLARQYKGRLNAYTKLFLAKHELLHQADQCGLFLVLRDR